MSTSINLASLRQSPETAQKHADEDEVYLDTIVSSRSNEKRLRERLASIPEENDAALTD
jgi:hypothetical protein